MDDLDKVVIIGALLTIVFACSDGRADELEELEELEEQTSLMQEQAWNHLGKVIAQFTLFVLTLLFIMTTLVIVGGI